MLPVPPRNMLVVAIIAVCLAILLAAPGQGARPSFSPISPVAYLPMVARGAQPSPSHPLYLPALWR